MLLSLALLSLLTIASAVMVVRWPARWAHAVIWILVLQNAVVIVLWKATGSDGLATNLLYAKEVVIVGGSLVAIYAAAREAKAGRLSLVMWLVVAFGALCALWIPISYVRHEPLEQIARGLRSLVFPVLLLAIGALLVRTLSAAFSLRTTIWWTAIVLGVTVVLERSFIPLQFWISIGLTHYWVAVRGQSPTMLNGGLPWNFYLPLFGSVVRRGFGIMTDPLGLSYYLLLPLGLASAEIWRARASENRWPRLATAAALCSIVGITFSLSRVPIAIGLLLTAAGPVMGMGMTRKRQIIALTAASVVAFALVLGVSAATSPKVGPADLAANAPIDLGSDGSHQATLMRAGDFRPLIIGQGLGTAGYLSSKYASGAGTIGYENPFLDAAGQVGILGGLLLIAIVALSCIELLSVRGRSAVITLPTAMTIGALGIAGVVSGQLEVITSLGVTWMYVGVVLAATAREREPVRAQVSQLRDAVTPAESRS